MTVSSDVLVIIPSRRGSSRFPDKPLAHILGKPLIEWVYRKVSLAATETYVSTDDGEIFDAVKSFGGKVVMTDANYTNGSERCLAAYESISRQTGRKYDFIINVQGDEPLIRKEQVELLASQAQNYREDILTLATPFSPAQGDTLNPNRCCVVFDINRRALMFSRFHLPFDRDGIQPTRYRHLGIYGYSPKVLREYSEMKPGVLEKSESLEQNRWLENGRDVRIFETEWELIPIDVESDLKAVEKYLKNHPDQLI